MIETNHIHTQYTASYRSATCKRLYAHWNYAFREPCSHSRHTTNRSTRNVQCAELHKRRTRQTSKIWSCGKCLQKNHLMACSWMPITYSALSKAAFTLFDLDNLSVFILTALIGIS